MEERKKAILVDGYSLMHRAFYALPLLTSSQGEYTNAILGFTMMLLRLLEDEAPDYIGVAFDEKAPTFRHKEFTEYKGNRKPMPEELRPQVQAVRDIVAAFNIPQLSMPGYEADDVLGTAAQVCAERGYATYIVTGDRDMLQLVNKDIRALITRQGIKDLELYDYDKVVETYGVTPAQIPDLKGLTGDKSDNIPGVPGIGPKTAAKLLQQYRSVPELLENLDKLKGKQKELLMEHRENALLSLHLATIDCCVPVEVDLDAYEPDHWNVEELQSLFARYEFRQLLDKLAKKYPEKMKTGRKHVQDTNAAADKESLAGEGQETGQLGLFAEDQPAGWDTLLVTQCSQLDALIRRAREEGQLLIDLYIDGEDAMSGRLAAIGVGTSGLAALIPMQECYSSNITDISFSQFMEVTEAVLGDAALTKVGYDLKPLFVFARKEGKELPQGLFDVALAAYLCNPGQSFSSLEDLVLRFFDTYIPPLTELTGTGAKAKEYSKIAPEELLGYTERRLRYMSRLRTALAEKLEQDGLKQLFYQIEMPLTGVLAKMEFAGVSVDTNELLVISKELETRIDALTSEIYQLAGEEFNINSPKQLGVILFDKLKLPVVKKTKTGPSTSADVLEQLAEEHEIVDKILDFRQLIKLKNTYVDTLGTLVNPETGRIHTSFNQMVTATGRLSSTNPNLQNIPVRTEEGRRIRSAFIPGQPDYLILSADYSQIELRVLAHMSGDENLIQAFVHGEDIHSRTAAEVFGVPLGEVSPQMRSAAKAINFGIVYGISSFGLAKGTGLSRDDAQKYIDSYFERYPGVKYYLDWAVTEARAKGYVTTLFNRRRYLPDINSRKWAVRSFAERTAMNTPIQGSAADIIKMAMLEVDRRLTQSGSAAKLLLQVHDELVLEVPKDELMDVARLVKDAMENIVSLSVPLQVDVKAGSNWRDTEELSLS